MIELINLHMDRFVIKTVVIIICWLIPLLASGLDWMSAIHEAKKKGKKIYSEGMRRTIEKMGKYYSFMSFMFFTDLLLTLVWLYEPIVLLEIPYASIAGAVIVTYIEGKSVLEHHQKGFTKQLEKNGREVIELIKSNRDFFKKLLAESEMKESSEKEENHEKSQS